jgi:hypothetical protein
MYKVITTSQRIKAALVSLLIVAGSVVAIAAPAPVFAAASPFTRDACSGVAQVSGGNCNAGQANNTISGVVKTGINLLSFIVGIVAIVVIIIDGMKLAASNGDAQAATTARSGIVYALVALVIVSLAQFIVHFVLGHI